MYVFYAHMYVFCAHWNVFCAHRNVFCVHRYVFWSMHYDIKYGVFYKKSEEEKKEILATMERINAHQVPVDGWVKCDKPGICECDRERGEREGEGEI